MIIHLFNSSSVSGPERLVLPALAEFPGRFRVVNLREDRIRRLRDNDPLEAFSRSLNLPYDSVPVGARWDRAAVAALRAVLAGAAPELVHAHDVKASIYLLAARAPGARPFRAVSTHHGVMGRPDWKTRLYEWIYRRRALGAFDRVLAVSSADHELLSESGIGRDRLRLHLNGSNAPHVGVLERERASESIRALWLPEAERSGRPFLFGAVGRLSPEKNHARMLRTLARLDRLDPRAAWKCLVFGAGPLDGVLRRVARRLGLERRILWMGYRPDAGAEMAGLDLLLSFSKAEGLPVSLIEAGWAGTPVMATKVGGVADIIPNESFGAWVPPGEAPARSAERIRALLSDNGRISLRAQALRFQEYVERHFSREAWIRRLDQIYAELGVRVGRPGPEVPGEVVRQGGRDAVTI